MFPCHHIHMHDDVVQSYITLYHVARVERVNCGRSLLMIVVSDH